MTGSSSGAVTFTAHRVPVLDHGDYALTVTQPTDLDDDTYSLSRTFTVAGDRFSLTPGAVSATFPPDGALGDYGSALPHVVLTRATLPWERSPHVDPPPRGGPTRAPWLAVLVVAADEIAPPRTVTLGDLPTGTALERHQSATDPVTVIDVDPDLLPSYADLTLLAHVRDRGDGETAVVVASRLPPAGRAVTAHLVSLEGRFRADAFGVPVLDPPGAPVRLVSLFSWRFATVDPRQTFAWLAHDLARDGSAFRLPPSAHATAERFLGQGFVPLRRRLRDGGRDVCWYRGPLVGGPVDDGPQPPVRSADALLRFHPDLGMVDVGGSAAWQLGRLLALQSTDVAVQIRQWRRRRRHVELRAVDDTYPLPVAEVDTDLPPAILAWLRDLALLRGVPWVYLVPDEAMLPVESVRFVGVDQGWVRHLIDGACSIGRLSSADAVADAAAPPPLTHPTLTGALVRSALVEGYPDLVIEAFDRAGAPLLPARVEKVAAATVLCLFVGEIAGLDIGQHPGAQHFGIEQDTLGAVSKPLRRVPGCTRDPDPVGPFPLGPRGTVPVADLTAAIVASVRAAGGATSGAAGGASADLAAQLVEVAERVRFRLG